MTMLRIMRNQAGMSLMEMLLAITIGSILGIGIMQVFKANSALFSGEKKVAETYAGARNVVGTLSRQVRQLGYNPTAESTGLFGLKDSTGNFTTNAISSNSSIFFTMDDNGDGALQNNASERIGWRINGTTVEKAAIDPGTGAVSGWLPKYQNVTQLLFLYVYADGTGTDFTTASDGTITITVPAYPDNSVTAHAYSELRGINIVAHVRSRAKHDLTQQYIQENEVDALVLLRNNLR